MSRVSRRGWTLHEMLIALILIGGVIAIVAHQSLGHMRFHAGTSSLTAMRGQLSQVSAILRRSLWAVSPSAGDITAAQDSALEFHMTIGSSAACESGPGRVTIPAPASAGANALSGFWESPDIGDRMHVFFDDSLGSGWLALHLAGAPVPAPACAGFDGAPDGRMLILREALTVPVGAPLRFTRPIRFSLYRATDDNWYLGARDWNGSLERFNSIQPVAGPLRSYSGDRDRTGLHFVYRDADGMELRFPTDVARIARVTITARAEAGLAFRVPGLTPGGSRGYADSSSVTIAFRNAR